MTGRDHAIAQWRREEVEAIFRERFGDVCAAIESAGASWHVSSAGEFASSPISGEATIVIRAKQDRGFGITLSASGAALGGMRGKKYRIDDLADLGQNSDFIAELSRRIHAPGASRHDVLSDDQSLAHWKMRYRKPVKRTEAWNPSAY